MSKKQEELKEIEELTTRVQGLEDQLKRAVADYHNLEKRVRDDSLVIANYSKNQLVLKLLPILDSLDQAVKGAAESEAESGWLKGVLMSIKALRQVLSEEGLAEIEAEGEFNPEEHEAVDIREGEDNKILEIVERGYYLNGKVLRPAKVVVGKQNPVKISEEAKEELKEEEM